jgi:hypothetical protein
VFSNRASRLQLGDTQEPDFERRGALPNLFPLQIEAHEHLGNSEKSPIFEIEVIDEGLAVGAKTSRVRRKLVIQEACIEPRQVA